MNYDLLPPNKIPLPGTLRVAKPGEGYNEVERISW